MANRKSRNQQSILKAGAKAVGETIGQATRMAEGIMSTGASAIGLGPKEPRARADERTISRASNRGPRRKSAGGAKSRKATAKDTAGRTRPRPSNRTKTAGRTSRARRSTGRKGTSSSKR